MLPWGSPGITELEWHSRYNPRWVWTTEIDDAAYHDMNHPGANGLRTQKIGELIANTLRRQIVLGELKDGELLPPEAELMVRFDVSRPTMREAFRILESERLIGLRRGSSGARVYRPDARVAARYTSILLQYERITMADVFEARTVLESQAVRMMTAKSDPEVFAGIRAALEFEASRLEDVGDGTGANRFHQAILELCGNRTLSLLGRMLDEIVDSNYGVAMDGSSRKLKAVRDRAFRAHERLLELIESGQPDEAEAFWQHHMSEAARIRFRDRSGSRVVDLLD